MNTATLEMMPTTRVADIGESIFFPSYVFIMMLHEFDQTAGTQFSDSN
jgi:hypothetical protein